MNDHALTPAEKDRLAPDLLVRARIEAHFWCSAWPNVDDLISVGNESVAQALRDYRGAPDIAPVWRFAKAIFQNDIRDFLRIRREIIFGVPAPGEEDPFVLAEEAHSISVYHGTRWDGDGRDLVHNSVLVCLGRLTGAAWHVVDFVSSGSGWDGIARRIGTASTGAARNVFKRAAQTVRSTATGFLSSSGRLRSTGQRDGSGGNSWRRRRTGRR